MAVPIITCPACATRVQPSSDGTCPACRSPFSRVPSADSSSAGVAPAAEGEFPAAASEAPSDPLASLLSTESAYLEERQRIAALWQRNRDPEFNAACREWADQVEQSLLHGWNGLLRQLKDGGPLSDGADRTACMRFVETRIAAWESFLVGLRTDSTPDQDRHIALWEESERLRSGTASRSDSPEVPTPARLTAEFHRSLRQSTPRVVVTPILLAANLAVFGLMATAGVNPFSVTVPEALAWGAGFGPRTLNGEWWRLVTAMFLHFGVLHLAFNMYFLWTIGSLVERLVGPAGFALLYCFSGLMGSLASVGLQPLVVSAGASGAVFGLFGALLGFLASDVETIPRPVRVQLRRQILVFLGCNLLYGLTAPDVDLAAHGGGLVAGLAAGLILGNPSRAAVSGDRGRRNRRLMVCSAIAIPVAVVMLPTAPLDVYREAARLDEIEFRTIAAYNRLVEQAVAEEISLAEFANRIEQDVLSEWARLRAGMGELHAAADVAAADVASVNDYLEARDASWRLRVEGIRTDDAAKIEEADRLQERADSFAAEIAANP